MSEPAHKLPLPSQDFPELTPQPRGAPTLLPLKRVNTLWTLWHDFVKSHNPISKATEAHYLTIGRRFLKFMRGRDLSAQTVMEWGSYLRNHKFKQTDIRPSKMLSPQRINQINRRIRPFLRWLYRLGFAPEYLEELLPELVEPSPPPGKIITEEEYERLKAYMADKPRWQILLWLCILGYRTGMSLKDCVYLKRKQVHLSETSHSFIDIYRHKTRRLGEKALCQIPVVVGTDLHEWLVRLSKVENYKRKDGMEYVHVHQDAPAYFEHPTRRIDARVRYLFSGAENGPALCPGRTFKNFRNTLCSNLVNSGAQLALICKITGHNNVKTLLRYLNVDREALSDTMLKAYQYGETKG